MWSEYISLALKEEKIFPLVMRVAGVGEGQEWVARGCGGHSGSDGRGAKKITPELQ